MQKNNTECTKSMDEIYNHFSNINVNEHLEQKRGLDFLLWGRAVKMVKEFDPGFTFEFKTIQGKGIQRYASDGEGYNSTAEVICVINCCGHEFQMWLPVMDFKNKAIVNPTSRDINDNKMRCLVKNISINLGLGGYVYEGFKQPTQLTTKLENGSHLPSDALFTPNARKSGTPKTSVTQDFVSADAVSPNGEHDIRNDVVLIGYGDGEKTYAEVYGSNVKNIDSQITWVKTNGNGDKANQHLANLVQYRLLLTADHASSTVG